MSEPGVNDYKYSSILISYFRFGFNKQQTSKSKYRKLWLDCHDKKMDNFCFSKTFFKPPSELVDIIGWMDEPRNYPDECILSKMPRTIQTTKAEHQRATTVVLLTKLFKWKIFIGLELVITCYEENCPNFRVVNITNWRTGLSALKRKSNKQKYIEL